MIRRPRRLAQAFTLIELLLVLVILTVLAAVVVPKFVGRSEQARNTAAKSDVASLGAALDRFEIENNRYPTTQEGLQSLIEAPSGLPDWKGPYIDRAPKDPWGNPYLYRFPGQHNVHGFDLLSYGPNGQEGGGDDIANWTDK